MKHLGIYPKITKKYILDRVSQEEIMNAFLGFPVTSETLSSNSIKSPFRRDDNPSCNYYYNVHGKLRFRDHTTGLNFDCFDVVAYAIGVNARGSGFHEILHAVARYFRLNIYSEYKERVKYDTKREEYVKAKKKRKSLIIFKPVMREANYNDYSYFGQGGLEKKDLKGIFFIEELYISKDNNPYQRMYSYSPKDPCYGYYGKKDKDTHIHLWKFYFPFRAKQDKRGTRFISNGSFIQGLQYLKPDRVCIITKAFKDAKVFNKVGIQSVALSAETILPTKEEVFYIKSMCDYVVSCLDYDRTGLHMSWLLRKHYGIEPIMFTNGLFNTVDYGAKDAFAYTSLKGVDSLKYNIKRIYAEYKEDINKHKIELINY